MTAALLESLTAEQLAAVEADGPRVVVSAGPGSGKSRTIAARVAHLILARGVDPREILCCTFTRAACADLRSRIAGQVGPIAAEVAIETFHAAALRMLPLEAGEQVASDAECEAALRSIYEGPARLPARERPGIEETRRRIVAWEATGRGHRPPDRDVRTILFRLAEAKLVPAWHLMPRALDYLEYCWVDPTRRRYVHVLADESQDATQNEADFARLAGKNLYAVGDDAQAIYGWRGGGPGRFGEPTHRLSRTFRFGAEIADEANRVGVGAPVVGDPDALGLVERVPLPNRTAIVGILVDALHHHEGVAVLTRTHADAEAVEAMWPDRLRHVRRDPLDALSSPADRIAAVRGEGRVPVSTVHGFKGLESDVVIVVGPSTIAWGRASAEKEERRVLYVAMTRARLRLVLVTGAPPEEAFWRVRACAVTGEDL